MNIFYIMTWNYHNTENLIMPEYNINENHILDCHDIIIWYKHMRKLSDYNIIVLSILFLIGRVGILLLLIILQSLKRNANFL